MNSFRLSKDVHSGSFSQDRCLYFFACLICRMNKMSSSIPDIAINNVDNWWNYKSRGSFLAKHILQSVMVLIFALLFSICGTAAASIIDYKQDASLDVKKKQSQDKDKQNKEQFKLYLPSDKQQLGIQEQRAINSMVLDDVDQEIWEEAELTWKNMRQVASEIEKIWRKTEVWLNSILFKDIGDWQSFTAQPLMTANPQISASQYLKGFYNRLILPDQQIMHFNQHFSGIGILTLASKQSSLNLSNHAYNEQVEYYARQNSDSNKRSYGEPDKKAIVKLLYLWKRHFNKLAIVFGMIVIWLLIKNSIRLMRPKY